MAKSILPLTQDDKIFVIEIANQMRRFEHEIASAWAESYRRMLSKTEDLDELTSIFKEMVNLWLTSLAEGDFDRYFDRIEIKGAHLAKTKEQYENLIVSFHLYEEATNPYLQRLFPDRYIEAISVLDHLYHNVIAILARAYFSQLELEREKFVNVLAHDLRIPLTTILLLSEALSKTESSLQKAAETSERIKYATQTISNLIDNVLQYGRLKSGKQNLDRREIDLFSVARDAATLLLPHAIQSHLSLSINGQVVENWGQLPTLMIDADRNLIFRAISNYLSNAIKHAKSRVSLRISGERGKVVIAVQDDGPGIRADELVSIYEDYYVVPGKKSGTGLGLPSVRMIADLHNGKCWVESEVNQGSTFYLEVPLKVEKP